MNLSGRKIVIAGGSGFLGVSLATHFAQAGAEVTILARSTPKLAGKWRIATWDGRSQGDWVRQIDGYDAIVNLAGRTVNCIKTPDHQDEILRSRVDSTLAIGRAIRSMNTPPPVWIQMSTAHIYGDSSTIVCDEDAMFGYGFAPTVGRAWEQAFADSRLPTQRGVVLRTSFVIGRDLGAGGGALAMLGLLTRIGLGVRVGSGRQGMSWIHERDLNNLFSMAITSDRMQGAYIASAPHPVSQVDFMRTLRKVLGMPVGLPAYEWMVRIGAPLVFRTDPELALYGRYVVSKRLSEDGFIFQFPELEPALRDLYGRGQ